MKRQAWRHGAIALLVVMGLGASCTSGGDAGPTGTTRPDGGPSGTIDLDDVDLIAALQRYDSCEAFLADVKEQALARVGPYGLGGGGGWGFLEFAADGAARQMFGAEEGDDMAMEPSASPATTVAGVGGEGSADPNFSGTNVQELGVDEPDIVKTDGSILVTVTQNRLHVLDVSDPQNPTTLSSTTLAGYGAELLLHEDRLLVLQQAGYGWDVPFPQPRLAGDVIGTPAIATTVPADEVPGSSGRIAPGPYWPTTQLTTVAQVDLSDPTAPQVERTWTVEGGYVSARLVDGVARIVVRSTPSELPFVYPSTPQAEESAKTANRAVIEASTLEDWVPNLTVTGADGEVVSEETVAPCDQLYRPSVFAGFGMVTVLTADMGSSGLGDGDGVGVLSTGETVYASPTSLYVATNQWIEPETGQSDVIMPRPSGSQRTDIHQFSIEGTSPAQYLASGSVDGYLLNQFSMSEHGDHLRIAVTEGQWDPKSSSSVVILARRGEALAQVGSVGDLGLGEQIYAVRFMGDMGYVVTFRQIDPLYTLDLSDPANPQMVGELKIPGFSSYLHPVGEGLLVGIGQNATDDGRVLGSQVSLFDVSNPADPQRVDQLELGEGTNSEVEYDHRAFLFWNDLAVLPYISYQWDSPNGGMDVGAIGVEIDRATRSLGERGRITHADQTAGGVGAPSPNSSIYWDHNYGSQIRRSVVIDGTLFTLSERGLLASDLATLAPGAWVSLGG